MPCVSLLNQDFHFAFQVTSQYAPNRFRCDRFFILSVPSDSGGPRRGQPCPFRVRENQKLPHFQAISQTPLRPPSFLRPVCLPAAAPYPVGKGSAAIGRDDSELSSVIVRLSRLQAGQKARIAYLEGEGSPRIQKLLSLGLTPGRTIELLQRWPVIVVRVDATQVALDFDVADSVSVYSPL